MNKTAKLALLQLEQYDTARYLAARLDIDESVVKRARWTGRLKLTRWLSYPLGIVGANTLIGGVVKTAEIITWYLTQAHIAQLKKRGLKVIAIAGSYGKTSVKNYTYDLLRTKYRTVATPESFNTVLGIAKCLEYEVDEKTEVFIVEVGAYHFGDITNLLEMVQPDIGVLTGMARQHLTRFGSWENIQIAKSEIAVYMNSVGGRLVANGSDEAVVKNVEKLGVKATFYGASTDRNQINLAGAKEIASLFGITKFDVKVRQVKNRFEMTSERYGMKVIDDSFSSNDRGFIDGVTYLGLKKKYTRILVTPGLVELGSESTRIHEELGKQVVGNVDYVILVGHNDRTKSLERGINKKIPVIYIEKTLDFMQVVRDMKLKNEPMVLLENDVTENY